LIVNAGQTGYYRTLYSAAAMQAIIGGFAGIPAIDQLGIMADSWQLGLASYAPPSVMLDLAAATPANADSRVWARVAATFSAIDSYYDGDPHQAAFRRFASARLGPVLNGIGWTATAGEPAPVANLRETLISLLGDMGDPAVVAEARRRFAIDDLPPAIHQAVLSVVSTNADAATWEKLLALAIAEKTPLVKQELYDVLALPHDKALAQRALALALTDEPGATTSAGIIAGVSRNHPDLAFDFALANLEKVNKIVDQSSRSRYLPRLAGGSFDPAMIAKIRAYADKYLPADARRDAETAAAIVAYRIKVKQERLPAMTAWLTAHGG
jgi:aminopeptidase N